MGSYSGASLQRTSCQWSLSIKDELGVGSLSLIQWSLSTKDELRVGSLFLEGLIELKALVAV